MELEKMRILLINPPYTRLKGIGHAPYFPLGLGYIAAVLRDSGFEVKIYQAENPRNKGEFLNTEADASYHFRSRSQRKYMESLDDDGHFIWREVMASMDAFQPDIVGISVLSAMVGSALKVSRLCKDHDANCKVVWGGVHPTFLPGESLQYDAVDFVVRGEGEYTMLELCMGLRDRKDLSSVQGLSYKTGEQIIHNPKRELIGNLDRLPFPARDAVLYPESFDFKSLGSMIISRGCPFRCSFCSSRNFWERRERFRTPENIVTEINQIKKDYHCSYVMFWDDSLTINRNIIHKYCNALIDAQVKIDWKTATRADLVDEETLSLMQKAGCVKLEIGVESGSERMKKIIRKDVTNDQIRRAFQLIDQYSIGSGAFFMAGFPDETLDDLAQTFALMQELPVTEIAFNILDPMPGSRDYERCLELGLVPPDPDWVRFPFWPDAHYMKEVPHDVFKNYADKMAAWLYKRNNSLRFKFRRNKRLIFSLAKNDPVFLFEKLTDHVKRRWKSVHMKKAGVQK